MISRSVYGVKYSTTSSSRAFFTCYTSPMSHENPLLAFQVMWAHYTRDATRAEYVSDAFLQRTALPVDGVSCGSCVETWGWHPPHNATCCTKPTAKPLAVRGRGRAGVMFRARARARARVSVSVVRVRAG